MVKKPSEEKSSTKCHKKTRIRWCIRETPAMLSLPALCSYVKTGHIITDALLTRQLKLAFPSKASDLHTCELVYLMYI